MYKLKVIECGYCYAKWRAEMVNGCEVLTSGIRPFKGPRAIDYIRDKGTFDRANCDIEFYQVSHLKELAMQPAVAITRDYSNAVCSGIRDGRKIMAIGGYCNYAPAIVGGLQRALGKDTSIGVVWMDAHSDNVVVEETDGPVRLVGVPVSTMLGQTLPSYRVEVCGLEEPLKGSNMIMSDIRIMNESGAGHMEEAGVIHLDASQYDNTKCWKEHVHELAERVDVIFLMVDADILKYDYIPSYEKRVPYGHDLETVQRNVEAVLRTGKVEAMATFCFDFDHYDNDHERTSESLRRIIEAALDNWN